MKYLGISILFLPFSLAFAANPLIRICNVTGGVFHEVQTSDDHIGLCQYGIAMMDSLSVLETTSENKKNQAVEALESLTGKSCQEAGATKLEALDLEDKRFELCLFEDGSVVEAKTLSAGGGAANNAGLMKALRTRF